MSKKDKFSTKLNKLQQERRLLFILIFSLVAIFLWVLTSIFSTRQNKKISAELVKLAEPLVPTLDQAVLERVSKKNIFTKEDLSRFPIYVLIQSELGDVQVVDVVNQADRAAKLLTPKSDLSSSEAETPVASSSAISTSSTEIRSD
ncbi:MAG TPA: hypothetical protein PLM16_00125 [Candidatus Woesebacteria bacterium]|nr:hypothetical protein [Candidatus Woesebacteria bacterium]